MMHEPLANAQVWLLAQAWLAGTVLGAIYFGGLLMTIRRVLLTGRPALWVMGSVVFRIGLALSGFYLVADGDWQRLLACLLGFVMARQLLTHLTRPRGEPEAPAMKQAKEAQHAN
jgi:F1F0 ATPase subunit 2